LSINLEIQKTVTYESVVYDRALFADTEELSLRGGFKRVSGLAGNAVDTGYLLALYFPLSLWFLSQNKLINAIPFAFISAGIILLQTRAAFIAIFMSIIILLYKMLSQGLKDYRIFRFFNIRFIFISVLLIILLFTTFPQLISILTVLTGGAFSEEGGYGVITKLSRIPIAYNHFINNPFGYGSPQHAYRVVMLTHDVPAPAIYYLSGGIILGTIYLLMLWTLQSAVFNVVKKSYFEYKEKLFLITIGCGMISSIVVLFSNWREKHLFTAFILHIAVYKIYYLIPWFKQNSNT
jgi:hypothetical protein